jgi:hypothetical protein
MLAAKFGAVFPHLDERRLLLMMMEAEARALGHGWIRLVARAAGVRDAHVNTYTWDLNAAPARPSTRARNRERHLGAGASRVSVSL